MSCIHSKLRSISTGAIAAAIGISLSMAAMAQESPRLRTPRNLSTGLNQHPHLPFGDTTTAGNPNTAQGPGPGTDWPGSGLQRVSRPG